LGRAHAYGVAVFFHRCFAGPGCFSGGEFAWLVIALSQSATRAHDLGRCVGTLQPQELWIAHGTVYRRVCKKNRRQHQHDAGCVFWGVPIALIEKLSERPGMAPASELVIDAVVAATRALSELAGNKSSRRSVGNVRYETVPTRQALEALSSEICLRITPRKPTYDASGCVHIQKRLGKKLPEPLKRARLPRSY
jgi:hypothetical protein